MTTGARAHLALVVVNECKTLHQTKEEKPPHVYVKGRHATLKGEQTVLSPYHTAVMFCGPVGVTTRRTSKSFVLYFVVWACYNLEHERGKERQRELLCDRVLYWKN